MAQKLAVAIVYGLVSLNCKAAASAVDLGTSVGFAVLAGAGITVTGPTSVKGDIGTFPTPSITGFGNVVLTGVNHAGDGVTQTAKSGLNAAYLDAAGRPFTTSYPSTFDLSGLILSPGVFSDTGSLFLTGSMTLDAGGDANAVWIFQAGSTLITGSASQVSLMGGAQACNVFWQVGSSATLGTGSIFAGNILALTSITLDAGATVDGRVLALNGAVTLDSNTIEASPCEVGVAVPEAGSAAGMLVFGGAFVLFVVSKRNQMTVIRKNLASAA